MNEDFLKKLIKPNWHLFGWHSSNFEHAIVDAKNKIKIGLELGYYKDFNSDDTQTLNEFLNETRS